VLDVPGAQDQGNASGYTPRNISQQRLEEQTHPDILRSNLSNIVLELMTLGFTGKVFHLLMSLFKKIGINWWTSTGLGRL
jgi:hypothetical protein